MPHVGCTVLATLATPCGWHRVCGRLFLTRATGREAGRTIVALPPNPFKRSHRAPARSARESCCLVGRPPPRRRQCGALVHKNVVLAARSPTTTAAELLLPPLFAVVMAAIWAASGWQSAPTQAYVASSAAVTVAPLAVLAARLALAGQYLAVAPSSPAPSPRTWHPPRGSRASMAATCSPRVRPRRCGRCSCRRWRRGCAPSTPTPRWTRTSAATRTSTPATRRRCGRRWW